MTGFLFLMVPAALVGGLLWLNKYAYREFLESVDKVDGKWTVRTRVSKFCQPWHERVYVKESFDWFEFPTGRKCEYGEENWLDQQLKVEKWKLQGKINDSSN